MRFISSRLFSVGISSIPAPDGTVYGKFPDLEAENIAYERFLGHYLVGYLCEPATDAFGRDRRLRCC